MTFQVTTTDLAGRIGMLTTKHGTIETPALLPVVHPTRQNLPPHEIRGMGFDGVMTNAYLALKYARDPAVERGIHALIGFDGVIMTDSGGYQILEYGDVEATPEEVASFEAAIGTDIATILDRPTGFNATREYARQTVEDTVAAAKRSLDSEARHQTLWMGPIQGGKYLDLLRASARQMRRLRFDLYALGSPTEVMESYQFPLLAQMIHAVKTVLPLSKPLHLFGAGHPLTLPLAVALGCDTFDSASYALYAREGRYLTGSGTRRLEKLTYLPCVCPICQATTVQELRSGEESPKQLARHNLWVLRHEMIAVKQAIREGRLWEYLGIKARCHPKLWEAYQLLGKFHTLLEDGTPAFKDRSPFLFNPVDAQRPEVSRARRRIAENLRIDSAVHVVFPEQEEKPYSRSLLYGELVARLGNLGKQVQIFFLIPALGPVPAEVGDVYPFPQCLYPTGFAENREVAQVTLKQATKLLRRSGRILIVDGFPRHVVLMGKLQKRLRGSLLARLASTLSVGDAADRVAGHVKRILEDTEAVPS